MEQSIKYLSDERGLYGIQAVSKLGTLSTITLRRDKLCYNLHEALLTPIPRSYKKHHAEMDLYNMAKTREMSIRCPWVHEYDRPKLMPPDRRKLYFAVPWYMRRVFNGMYKKLLQEAADQDALKWAYKFNPEIRWNAYVAGSYSPRSLQLMQAFPVLAERTFAVAANLVEKRTNCIAMVESGAKLRDVAEAMGIPMAFRKIKPGAAHVLEKLTHQSKALFSEPAWRDRLHAHIPTTTLGQIRWLYSMWIAFELRQQEYAFWLAKNVPHDVSLKSGLIRDVRDLGDWFRDEGRDDIGWARAKELSREWHRNVYARRYSSTLNLKFPDPWLPQDRINDFDIIPLTGPEQLVEEGQAMHHCVGSYARAVASGRSFIYSVRHGDKRVGTLEIQAVGNQPEVAQFRAECNKEPPKQAFSVVKAWLSRHEDDFVPPKLATQTNNSDAEMELA